jgi:hypothetical protein
MILVEGYAIDASITEEHSLEAEITEYPIEGGGTISDHRRKLPRSVTMEIIVSDTPLGDVARVRELEDQSGLSESGALPSEEAFAFFEQIHEDSTLCEVVTNLRTYQNMLLESIAVPDDAETGAAFVATVTFREALIVENRRTYVDVALPRGMAKRDLGSRGAREVGGPSTDPVTGRTVKYIVPGPGEPGRFWYVSSGGVPIRPLTQEELDDMNAALEAEAGITYGPNAAGPPATGDGRNVVTSPGHYVDQSAGELSRPAGQAPPIRTWWGRAIDRGVVPNINGGFQ